MRFFRLSKGGHYAYSYYLRNKIYSFTVRKIRGLYLVNSVEVTTLLHNGDLYRNVKNLPTSTIARTLKAAKIPAIQLIIELDKQEAAK